MMASPQCEICNDRDGKYVCPRCNIRYCSVACYQAERHLHCSEAFYKESVLEHVNNMEQSPEEIAKMNDILKTFHEEADDEVLDSDDDEDLAERLGSVDLNDPDAIWEKLSESEQRAFVDMIKNGSTENLIPIWNPWWMYRQTKKLIEDTEQPTISEQSYVQTCPSLMDVPSLTQISSRPPAPCVKWNIINVLASYAYMMRFYNGEPEDFSIEAISLLVSLSGNLKKGNNYESYELAIEEVAYAVNQHSWLDGSKDTLSTMKDDVQKILMGPEDSKPTFYLQAALSDICRLMRKVKNDKTGASKRKISSFYKQFNLADAAEKVPKEKLKLCIKKIEYFLSWAKAVHCEDT